MARVTFVYGTKEGETVIQFSWQEGVKTSEMYATVSVECDDNFTKQNKVYEIGIRMQRMADECC
jgi:hypothetical protein